MTTHLIFKPARFLMLSLLVVLALFSMPTKAQSTGTVDDPDNGILPAPSSPAPSPPAPSSSSHPPPIYQLTVEKVGMGTIQAEGIHCGSDCLQYYIIDTPVTLTAIAADGFRFTGWKGDCDTSGQVQMTADKSCTAIFTPFSAGYASTPTVETGLDFGQTMVGKAINLRLVVQETGDLPLELKSAKFVGQQADAFRILSGKPPVIIPNAGKAHGLLLQCLPQAAGIHETTLILTTNDPSQATIRYPVICEGVKKVFIAYDSEPAPSSTLNWTSVVGQPSVVSLTILETGTDTLDIVEARFSGQHASDFSLIDGKPPLSLPDGDSPQTLKMQCLPSVVGVREATLTLTTTDPVQPTVTYTLKCTGLKPATYASEPLPSSTLSMRAKVGQSGVVDLKILEVGDSTLEVSKSLLTGEHKAEFSIPAGQLPVAISEGGPAHTLTVHCIPRALGTRTATLSLITNDPARPTVTYPLQCLGLGTPGYSSVPAPERTLPFGRSLVGTALTQSLTIQETGNTTLTLNESRLSGTHASDFRVVTVAFPLLFNDGDAAQPITLECVPSEAGERVATLHLTTNDPALPSVSYTLTCQGLDPERHHPPTDIVLSHNTVLANVKVDTLIGHLSTVDPDPSDEHRYTLTAGGPFKIVGNQLRVAAVLTAGDYPITITTTDNTDFSFTKNFTIQVNETIITNEIQANRQPTDISLSNDTLSKNNEIGTPIGLVSTLDFDRHDVHSYTLSDDASGRFRIVDNQLQLASEVEIKPYTITITTTDKAGSTFSKDFIITIHGNEAPTDIFLLGETVEKKTPTGAWVSTLYTVDPNPDDTHRYTLNNDAKGRFKIIGNELRVASMDFKSGTDYLITITTTDPGELSFRKDFTIQVCDEAHALYHVEENRLFMPLLDVWLFDPLTQQPLKEVGVFKGDLMLITGTEDLKVVTDSLAFLYTLPKPSACHARYQNSRFYIPYLDVPSISAWPDTRSPAQIQTFAVVLKQLSTDYTVFHLESYKIRSSSER